MPDQPVSDKPVSCPVCKLVKGQRLHYPSKLANMDIFQYGACGHVWTVPPTSET
jgi:hypothetical protein